MDESAVQVVRELADTVRQLTKAIREAEQLDYAQVLPRGLDPQVAVIRNNLDTQTSNVLRRLDAIDNALSQS